MGAGALCAGTGSTDPTASCGAVVGRLRGIGVAAANGKAIEGKVETKAAA